MRRHKIERTRPREEIDGEPSVDARGRYTLGNPARGPLKHRAEHEVKVSSLREAAELIRQGNSIRMSGPGLRPSLVSPRRLRISEL